MLNKFSYTTPANKKRSIGKLDNNSGMLIPNKTYYEIYGEQAGAVINPNADEIEINYGEVRSIGIFAVITAILEKQRGWFNNQPCRFINF